MKANLIPVLFVVFLFVSGKAFPQATDLPVRNGIEFSPRWIGKNGETIYSMVLKRSQLTPSEFRRK